jgi:signal transduction histidine kinase
MRHSAQDGPARVEEQERATGRVCRRALTLDYFIFSFGVVAAFAGLHLWMRRTGRERDVPLTLWAAVLALLVGGWFLTEAAGKSAMRQIRAMVEGFPPTYAHEIERLGHAALTPATEPGDPAYLAMIDAEIRWEKANPSVADIYTMRRLPDGRIALMVDSETDYDRSGGYDGEREQRTAIGEIFDKDIPALNAAFAGTPGFTERAYADRWGRWVSAFYPLRGADGRVEAVLGVDYPAEQWLDAITHARLAAIGAVLILAIVLGGFSTVVTLLRSDLRNRTLAEQRARELNTELERRVAERTAELEATHRQLVTASHRAGMAEVATGVLHNVGNVLNSVSVSAAAIGDHARHFKVESLRRVAEMLHEREARFAAFFSDDHKLQKIPSFLTQVAKHFAEQQTRMLQEIAQLRKFVSHMDAVVAMQQGFARISGEREPVAVVALVEDALRINASSLAKSGVAVERRFDVEPTLPLDKHKALQVLVNMIRNARQACEEAGRSDARIVLRVSASADDVNITVADNGVGIHPDNLARIFTHGFTTKKNGHGFGLHSSTVAARELGGDLRVHSHGVGCGAEFTLRLPARAEGDTAIGGATGRNAAPAAIAA